MEGGKNEDEDEDSDELDGEKKELPKKNIVINPARIYITATLGITFANLMSLAF